MHICFINIKKQSNKNSKNGGGGGGGEYRSVFHIFWNVLCKFQNESLKTKN